MQRKIFNIYVGMVLNSLGIERDEFFSKTKRNDITQARYMLYWALFTDAGGDFKKCVITRMMKENGYDVSHSTVHYGIEKMENTEDKYHLKIKHNICSV